MKKLSMLAFLLIISTSYLFAGHNDPLLLVIDMQPYFGASQENDLAVEVLRKITNYKKKNRNIVIVEYKNCGPSRSDINQALENYPNAYYITKKEDDGGEEVMTFLEQHQWYPSRIDVMGINTCACVKRTINKLASLLELNHGVTKLLLNRKSLGCYECNEQSCSKTLSHLAKINNVRVKGHDIAQNITSLILLKHYHVAKYFIDSSPWILKRLGIRNYIMSMILKNNSADQTKKEQLHFLFDFYTSLGISLDDSLSSNGQILNLFIKNNASADMVDFIIDKGASLERISPELSSPLQNAIDRKRYDIIDLLLKRGANINALDKKQHSLVDNLVSQFTFDLEEADMLQYLLTHGADATAQSLHLAQSVCNKMALTILEKATEKDIKDDHQNDESL